jgi:hypothetical protein
MGIEETLEAIFFALVEDLDEVLKELHVVLATVNPKDEERKEGYRISKEIWSAGG